MWFSSGHEPYSAPPDHPHWVGDVVDSAAIIWHRAKDSSPFSKLEAGEGFVAVRWESISVIGTYISPFITLVQFEEFVDRGIALGAASPGLFF